MTKRILAALSGFQLIIGALALAPTCDAHGSNTPPIAGPDNFSMLEDGTVSNTVGGNDSDAETANGDLVWAIVSGGSAAANGSLGLNDNGTFTYTPNTDFNGSVQFTYQVCDLDSACVQATVTIDVGAVNDGPIANDDSYGVNEDNGLSNNAGVNDGDVDNTNGQLLWTLLNGGTALANGQLFFNPGGDFTYVPNADFNGNVAFSYRVCDPGGLCDEATVTIAVAGVNDPPIVSDDNATTNEEQPVDIAVTGNDSDSDGNTDVGTLSILFQPNSGTVSVGIGGVLTYTPNANSNGPDQFTYLLCDDGTPLPSACDQAVVMVNVLPVNDGPSATGEGYATTEDGADVSGNVSTNDFDPDNALASLTWTVLDSGSAGANGILLFNTDGSFTYDPTDNFNGNVTFLYEVCDPGGLCAQNIVVITIAPVNDAPVVVNDNENTLPNTVLIVNAIANDDDPNDPAGGVDPTSVTIIAFPLNGNAVANTNGSITYTPNPGYLGLDAVQYTICDLGDAPPPLCDTGFVLINVTDELPIAVDDVFITDEDLTGTFDVLANDSTIIGSLDPATVTILSPPSHGTVMVNGDGTIEYVPDPEYGGADDFNYQVCNTGGFCSVAALTVVVQPVNDPPVASDDAPSTSEEVAVVIDVLLNDTEPNDIAAEIDTTSVSIVGGPNGGSAVVNADGSITYTPGLDFAGTDTITYVVCDDGTPLPPACDTALAVINVGGVNDAPVIAGDTLYFSTNEDLAALFCIAAIDVDGDTIDVTNVVSGPFNGTATGLADGDTCFAYSPDADYFGSDTLIVTVCDGNGECDEAVVIITVNPINDAPMILDGLGLPTDTVAASTPEDTPVTICLNAFDADGDAVQASDFINGPFNGFVNGLADGDTCFTYTPTTNYNGADTVDIIVCDGNGGCDTVTVVIEVTPVNDPPVIDDGNGNSMDTLTVTVSEDTPLNLCIPATDADGDALDITAYTNGPASGSIFNILDGNTCFTYAPDANYSGPDSVNIVVSDGNGGTDTLVLIITVTPVNDLPVITDGNGTSIDSLNASTPEDTPITICLDAIDADGDTLDVSGFLNGPANGTMSGIADGDTCFTYTPNADWSGSDTVDVLVCDGNGGCDTLTVVIAVIPVNDPPIILNNGNPADTLNLSTDPDVPLVICPEVVDADGDSVDVVSIINGPDSGAVSGILDGDTCFTYTPNGGFIGTDTMTVVVSDGNGGTDTVVVIVSVFPNDPPVADSDTLNTTTPEDTPLVICIGATDPNGDPVDVTAVINGPLNGGVSGLLDGDTCFTYTPAQDWFGTDTMMVLVCDPLNTCDTVLVIVVVTPVNDVPVITDGGGVPLDTLNAGTDEDTQLIICLDAIDADGDTLDIVSVINGPLNGQVTGILNGDTCFTYTPNADWNGADTMEVVVCDDNGGCDTLTVIIGVASMNDLPIAVDDVASTLLNTSVVIDVQDNDSDADGDALTTFSANANNGSVTINGDGSITYLPNLGFCGTDTITYTITDGNGGSDTAIVVVDVACVNNPPIAVNDVTTTAPGVTITIDVLINDSDPDGDVIGIIGASASNGSVVLNGDSSITYTPDSGFCGVDTITYTISDGNGGTDAAIVIVDVPCPNEPPIAVNDTASVEMEGEVTIDILDNDSDPNGDPLTVTDASANNGTVFINGDGTITYTPAAGFCGSDTITYTICDPEPLCDTAIVVVHVACPDPLMIPSGFSPNGDNIADTWVIQGLEEYPGASVTIFNRWGNTVFSADPYANDWTGVSSHGLTIGDVLPAGTYWYMLDLGPSTGSGQVVEGEEVRSGYIYLNR